MVRILVAMALLGTATSLLYFDHFKNFESPDTAGYVTPAAYLAAGHGFLDYQRNPDTFRTPGYPILIAPFVWMNLDLKYLVLFQHLLRVLMIVGTCYAAFVLTGSRRQALIAGVVLCIDLPFLRSANTLLTETVFTVVLGAVLILLWRVSRRDRNVWFLIVFAGLLAGTLVLIRPVALFFFLPASAFIALTRETLRFRAALTIAISFFAIPLLWSARNYHQAGYFGVSSISGRSILYSRAAGVLAIGEPGDFYSNVEKQSQQLEAEICRQWEQMRNTDCSQMTKPDESRLDAKYGRRIILQHPLAYLKLAVRGLGMTMLTGSPATLSDITGISFNTSAKLLLLYTVPAFALSLLGLWAFWKNNKRFFWLSVLTCVYFVGISSGAESFARFRVPVMPLYAILIAAGAEWALKFRSTVSTRRDRSVDGAKILTLATKENKTVALREQGVNYDGSGKKS